MVWRHHAEWYIPTAAPDCASFTDKLPCLIFFISLAASTIRTTNLACTNERERFLVLSHCLADPSWQLYGWKDLGWSFLLIPLCMHLCAAVICTGRRRVRILQSFSVYPLLLPNLSSTRQTDQYHVVVVFVFYLNRSRARKGEDYIRKTPRGYTQH